MTIDATPTKTFAPTGRLRAAINLGNPILAGRGSASGAVKGVSVDLAMRLGERLGVAVDLVVVDAAGKSMQVVKQDEADVGFFAIDPVRPQLLAFTPPYVLIEGSYLVRDDSPVADALRRHGIQGASVAGPADAG